MTAALVTIAACAFGWALGVNLASVGMWCVHHGHATLTGPGPDAYLD
jgi:hypothetical protein